MAKTKPTQASPALKAPATGSPNEGGAQAQVAAKFVAAKSAAVPAGKNPIANAQEHKGEDAHDHGPAPVKIAMLEGDSGAYAEIMSGAAPEAAPAQEGSSEGEAAAEAGAGGGISSTALIVGGVLLGGAGIAAAAGGGGSGGSANKAPTVSASSQAVTTKEDTAANISVSATDPNGDTLSYSAGAATNGTVTGGANGAFVYTPRANFNGTDSFVVTVSDGKGGTVSQTVNVTISAVNDAPAFSAASRSLTTTEDKPVSFTPSATDVDGDTLTYTVSGATGGTAAVGTDGQVTFTPTANFAGDASFVLTASDGKGGTAAQTINVAVSPVNDAPTFAAATRAVSGTEDQAVTIQAQATDVDGDALTYSASGATNGTVAAGSTPGSFVFTPNANFNGTASFQLTAKDPSGATATQTVNISFAPVNDAPTIDATATRSLTTSEDTQVAFVIDASDVDTPDSQLAASIATAPAHGTIVTDEQGNSFYRPDANFNGTDSFVVAVSDGQASTSYTVNVTVTPVNDAPSFASATRTLTIDEDQPVSFDPGASDVDGDTLTYSVGNLANGTASVGNDGRITFTPAANFHGEASFVLTASDGHGGVASQTVSITVVNQPDIVNLDTLDQLANGGDADPTTVRIFDASATDFRFDDGSAQPSNSRLTGFSSDDYVQVDAAIENYNFSSNGTDIFVSYQTDDGSVNLFQIDDVVTDSSVLVYDEASAEQAVGFDFFRTSAPPQSATTISLDVDTDNNLNSVALFSGAGFATTFTDDANSPDFVQIRNFGADDRISVSNADASDFNFSSNGTDIFISYQTPGGASNDITILGAVRDGNVLVSDEASAELAVGFDFFQAASGGGTTPTPPAQTSTLDVDTDNNLNTQALFSAAGVAATFTENANIPDYVKITGFGSDDHILVTNAASGDFNFSSNGTDLFISYQTAGGTVNDISIIGVVQDGNVLVFDEASAEQAVGFDFFQFG